MSDVTTCSNCGCSYRYLSPREDALWKMDYCSEKCRCLDALSNLVEQAHGCGGSSKDEISEWGHILHNAIIEKAKPNE